MSYDTETLDCARLIAEDPDRYPEALRQWAEKVLQDGCGGRLNRAPRDRTDWRISE